MSAGDKAITLAEENPNWKECDWRFTCDCGYQGIAPELLVEEDDTTLWCPQCRTTGWIWDGWIQD